jgi:hypothetical protein
MYSFVYSYNHWKNHYPVDKVIRLSYNRPQGFFKEFFTGVANHEVTMIDRQINKLPAKLAVHKQDHLL